MVFYTLVLFLMRSLQMLQTDRQTDRHTYIQAGGHTYKQADRKADIQTDTQTDRQTYIHTDGHNKGVLELLFLIN